MEKRKNWIFRDPHFYWKMINIVLALAVLVLAGMILLGRKTGWLVPLVFLPGALMCALEGIMQLSKGRRVLGYVCSIFAGILLVAMIISFVLWVW